MAKKSSASQSRSGSKKKTSRSRASSAKKKTAASSKAPVKKKTTAKKTSKKKVAAKKTTSKKKTAAKKATNAKKPVAKKSTAKKTTAKKVTSKKKTTAKKASTSTKSKSSGKASSNGDASTAKRGGKNKAPAPLATLGDAQEAARKLAAAAGLGPLTQRSTLAEEKTTKTKRVRRSPVKPEQLEEFRLILMQKRSEVLGDVTEMENEALGGRSGALSSFPQHLADQGSDEYDQSLALGLAASQRKLLAEIDAALDRIENGTYGICESLGIPISRQRLEAQPWARVSLEGARQQDSYTAR